MCSKGQRRNHKLTEWSDAFIGWARTLPYAQQLLFIDELESLGELGKVNYSTMAEIASTILNENADTLKLTSEIVKGTNAVIFYSGDEACIVNNDGEHLTTGDIKSVDRLVVAYKNGKRDKQKGNRCVSDLNILLHYFKLTGYGSIPVKTLSLLVNSIMKDISNAGAFSEYDYRIDTSEDGIIAVVQSNSAYVRLSKDGEDIFLADTMPIDTMLEREPLSENVKKMIGQHI